MIETFSQTYSSTQHAGQLPFALERRSIGGDFVIPFAPFSTGTSVPR